MEAAVMANRRAEFVKAVINGTDPHAAVVAAGYKGNARRTLRRLLRREDVADAIGAQQNRTREALEHIEQARQLAMDHGDACALVAAIEIKCRLSGLLK